MLTLIKRDLMLYRTSLMIVVLLCIATFPITLLFIGLMTEDSAVGIFIQFLGLFMGFLVTTAIGLDKEKKVEGHMIYYSLPIERDLIITARYVTVAMIPLLQSLVNLFLSYIFKWTGGFEFLGTVTYGTEIKAINIFNMLVALGFIFFLLSIYLYAYFRNLNKEKKESKLFQVISSFLWVFVYLAMRLIPQGLVNSFGKTLENSLGRNLVILVIFIVSILAYYTSMKFSISRSR